MGTRDEYVASLKSTFSTLLGRAIKSWLVLNAPFTQWPVIKIVINMAIDKMVTALADFGELQAFILFIDIRVGQQGEDMVKAMNYNKWAQAHGNAREKQLAEANLIAAHTALISLKH